MSYLGIIFALVALVSWGVGDFLIQRSTRKFGDWESLLMISLVGSFGLFPFVVSDFSVIQNLSLRNGGILILVSLSFLASALINFEALKKGKLAVVESVGAIEIVVAGFLSYLILAENLTYSQWFLVVMLIVGILMVALKPHHFKKETWLEKGAVLAMLGAMVMGISDFMIGFSSREINPILTIWVFNVMILAASLVYLASSGRFGHFLKDFKSHPKFMIGAGALDTMAWFSFAMSTLFVPIVVSLALSESYIILATTLGIFVNKEKLKNYQYAGIVLAIIGVITLSVYL